MTTGAHSGDSVDGWQKITTERAFLAAFSDKQLFADDLRFVIHSDGTMTGTIGDAVLRGNWYWRDIFFCRTAELDGEDLGLDCEIIEARGNQMRYTRNEGAGEASVVTLA